jgi:hypothetical protein
MGGHEIRVEMNEQEGRRMANLKPVRSNDAQGASVAGVDMKLEVVIIAVSDV